MFSMIRRFQGIDFRIWAIFHISYASMTIKSKGHFQMAIVLPNNTYEYNIFSHNTLK